MCAITWPQSPLDFFCALVLLSTMSGRSLLMTGLVWWAVCDSQALNEPFPTLCSCWLLTLTLDCRPSSSANPFLMVPGFPISWRAVVVKTGQLPGQHLPCLSPKAAPDGRMGKQPGSAAGHQGLGRGSPPASLLFQVLSSCSARSHQCPCLVTRPSPTCQAFGSWGCD